MSVLASVASAVFWGVVLLSVLVFVHEAGHFLSARAFGMRVTEFFLGMPCRLRLSWRSRSRGTEVGVTPILLGGYTRICGMDGEAGAYAAAVLGSLARRGRATLAQIAGDAGCSEDEALSALAVLVDWASVEPHYDPELGETPGQKEWPESFQTVRRDARLLTAFDRGHDFSQTGSTEAGEPHTLPEGGAEALLASERARTYQGKGVAARLVTLPAGPAVNIVLGLALVAGTLSVGGVTVARDVSVVGAVQASSMAEASGIEVGDRVTSVAGKEVATWTEMGSALKAAIAAGSPFELRYERSGEELATTIDPSAFPGQSMFGVTASTELYHPAILDSLRVAWNYVGMTASYVLQLFQPQHAAEVVSQSSSVVGISVMASEAASSGITDFLFLMAAISLSLGFMNLIPIPPLDGGKVLIELVQLVSRRQVPYRAQTYLSYVGLALAMLLFVFVLRQDIVRFVLGG